jgi:hypothetical protein
MQQVLETWPAYALVLFGVAAGQFGRIGQRLERGETLRLRHLFAELSMLPAFASFGGALAIGMDWPIWAKLGFGIAAGWSGFGMFRTIVVGLRQIASRFLESTAGKEA